MSVLSRQLVPPSDTQRRALIITASHRCVMDQLQMEPRARKKKKSSGPRRTPRFRWTWTRPGTRPKKAKAETDERRSRLMLRRDRDDRAGAFVRCVTNDGFSLFVSRR